MYRLSDVKPKASGEAGRVASPGRVLDISAHSMAGNSSLNLSQMPTISAIRDAHLARTNLNTTSSPLHPQRLFNPAAAAAAAAAAAVSTVTPVGNSERDDGAVSAALRTQTHRGADSPAAAPPSTFTALHEGSQILRPMTTRVGSGVDNLDVVSMWDRPARRMSAPIISGGSGVALCAANPSPGRPRFNPFLPRAASGGGSGGLTMGFSGEVSTPLTVRSFLDDFCEHKEIGRGSFGRVFSCRRKIDLALYAVKEINHEFRSDRERERYVLLHLACGRPALP